MSSDERGEPAIAVRDLRKVFGDVASVDGVSFDVDRGEMFVFLGPERRREVHHDLDPVHTAASPRLRARMRTRR